MVATENVLENMSAEERDKIRQELAEARAAGMMPRFHMSIFSRPKILAKAVTSKPER
ncbi:MAG: hypothetical protein LW865_02070 [Betaproteobacteria bacterium]|jgi:hypothetical protein|nr:hypothetical protein [Betaproteobacteria bacterium]